MRLWRSWRRAKRIGPLLAQAIDARDRRDWQAATASFTQVLELDPQNGPIWVQYGHALKELGSVQMAEKAYARAVALLPGDADAHLQHGHALKLVGQRERAVAALAESLRLDPASSFAYDELVRLGARDRSDDSGAAAARARSTAQVERASQQLAAALDEAASHAAYPIRSYDQFRRDFPIARPPGRPPADPGDVLFVIDAQGAVPALLRSTLLSLIDQAVPTWRATVVGSPELAAHPVGSFVHVDPRIAFGSLAGPGRPSGPVITLDAGSVLDPEALSWFLHAAGMGPAVVYADHDRGREVWSDAIERFAPAFYWAYDPAFFAATAELPAVVLAQPAAAAAVDLPTLFAAHGGEALRRALLLAAGNIGGATHVPRLLATRLDLPRMALDGRKEPEEPARPIWSPAWHASRVADAAIHVVIPTRDKADMLDRCVQTIRDGAARLDRLRITVVDNRSVEEATRRLLTDGVATGRFDLRLFDEPFNWSRVNNLGVVGSDAEILLFLNNDTAMLTDGWDDRLRERFGDPGIGAVGARLVYPNGQVQHAGILLGRQNGLPVHEALGAQGADRGPMSRWVTPRSVSAVTGAFLAVTRAAFERIGGFDERMFVAYNDVDLCLRLREAGLAIVYEPAIELIHHESHSRGEAVTRSQIAWDHAERHSLYRLWGDAMMQDPSYNPHWPSRGVPFDGLREPTPSQIAAYIRRSAQAQPWRVDRAAATDQR